MWLSAVFSKDEKWETIEHPVPKIYDDCSAGTDDSVIELHDQHTEYRRCHLGGAVYLGVEAALWLLSASLGASRQIPAAMLVLAVGGMFIHPIALLCSRLLRLPSPDKFNRLPVLTTWIALTIPLGLPLVFMATRSGHENLFFPAFAVLVGAHWLPFAYIYSMKSYLAIAGILVLAGVFFGFVLVRSFSACGFFVAGILLLFAAIHYFVVRRQMRGSRL